MPGKCGPVLLAGSNAMVRHRRQVQQHREPGCALHQGPYGRTLEPEDEVALPMPWHRPVARLCRTFADHYVGTDEGFAPPPCARPRNTQCAAGAQTRSQLAPQRTSALHIQRLVDGLMADLHCLIARKVVPQPIGNLLRTPSHTPSSVLPAPMPASLPPHDWSINRRPAGSNDPARQPILHVGPQRRVGRELRSLWAARSALSMPLRSGRPILQTAASCCGISTQLSRNRRR